LYVEAVATAATAAGSDVLPAICSFGCSSVEKEQEKFLSGSALKLQRGGATAVVITASNAYE